MQRGDLSEQLAHASQYQKGVLGKKGSDEIQKFIRELQDEALNSSGQQRICRIIDLPAELMVLIATMRTS